MTFPLEYGYQSPWNPLRVGAAQWLALPWMAARRRLDVVHGLANVVPIVQPRVARVVTRTALPPELGHVTLEQLLQKSVLHDLNHTIQAKQALMQPFISGCGPWRKYFAGHDIASK